MNDIIKACRTRSRIIDCLADEDGISLDELIDIQRKKLHRNRSVKPMTPPEDFYSCVRRYLSRRTDEKTAAEAEKILRCGAVNTADHHGGIYSPQSFQGDLLFGRLLEKEGFGGEIIPVLSTGAVALGSSTFARGIQCFCSPCETVKIPLYSKKQINMTVTAAPAYDAEKLQRFERTAEKYLSGGRTLDTVKTIIREIYGRESILEAKRYGDQLLHIGAEVTGRALRGAYPPVISLEAEELILPVIDKDIRRGDPLLSLLLYDSRLSAQLSCTRLPDGTPLSQMLFMGIDRCGRKYPLTLCGDGYLRVRDISGNETSFPAAPDSLSDVLSSRKVIPSAYLLAVILAWERGITWLDGIFQAEYLPAWQAATADALEKSGHGSIAQHISAYDCTGYISGPVFLLNETYGGAAVNAGPAEFIAAGHCPDISGMIKNTSVRDSHIMGMFEFYNDLTGHADKKEGWYESIARYCTCCRENLI